MFLKDYGLVIEANICRVHASKAETFDATIVGFEEFLEWASTIVKDDLADSVYTMGLTVTQHGRKRSYYNRAFSSMEEVKAKVLNIKLALAK